jgi:hypothetical protein
MQQLRGGLRARPQAMRRRALLVGGDFGVLPAHLSLALTTLVDVNAIGFDDGLGQRRQFGVGDNLAADFLQGAATSRAAGLRDRRLDGRRAIVSFCGCRAAAEDSLARFASGSFRRGLAFVFGKGGSTALRLIFQAFIFRLQLRNHRVQTLDFSRQAAIFPQELLEQLNRNNQHWNT